MTNLPRHIRFLKLTDEHKAEKRLKIHHVYFDRDAQIYSLDARTCGKESHEN